MMGQISPETSEWVGGICGMGSAPGRVASYEGLVSPTKPPSDWIRAAASAGAASHNPLVAFAMPGLSLMTNSSIPLRLSDADEEDAASQQATNIAEWALLEYRNIVESNRTFSVAPVSFSQFEHRIIISWELFQKSVVLICPADGSPAKLYREIATDDGGARTNLKENSTSKDLFDGITWMLSGTTDL